MDIHKNEKDELRLWAKDDIVPRDLQALCKQAATSINELQKRIKELETENKRLRELVRCSNCAYWIGEKCDYWENPEKEIGKLEVCKEFKSKPWKE